MFCGDECITGSYDLTSCHQGTARIRLFDSLVTLRHIQEEHGYCFQITILFKQVTESYENQG